MGYNVIDLIDRCIQIEEIKLKYLEEIIEKNKKTTIQIMCKVFFKEIEHSISFYDNLKESIDDSEIDEINIMTYDKISFLFNGFISRIYIPELNSPREYLRFALDLEEDRKSLFIYVQGRLYNDSKDDTTMTYKVLTKIIERCEKQIEDIKKTLL